MAEADEAAKPTKPEELASEADASRPTWRESWQVPTLALAGVLLIAGFGWALTHRAEPDFAARLDEARALLDDDQAEAAIAYLNEKVFAYEARGELEPALSGRFHKLLARSLFVAQKDLGIVNATNNRNIVESYALAEERGVRLSARDTYFLASTHIAIGHLDAALARARRLPSTESPRRLRIIRAAIDRTLEPGRVDYDRAIDLLASMLTEEQIDLADRAWAVRRQIEILLERGYPDDAITKTLREFQRLSGAPSEDLAVLRVLLARAYVEIGAIASARTQLDHADPDLAQGIAARGLLLMLRGRVEAELGNPQGARDAYEQVVRDYDQTDALLPALLGLGEINALLGNTIESLGAYRRLVDAMTRGWDHREVTPEVVIESLIAHANDQLQRVQLPAALEYAQQAQRLSPAEDRPVDVLLAMSRIHRAMADELLASDPSRATQRLHDLDPATREDARRHLIAAGSYFHQHANRVVLIDRDAHETSLWLAGDSFDLAGDQAEAIIQFQAFLSAFAASPRAAEARFRLAQAYQSRGEYELAEQTYESLIADRNDAEVKNVGLFGDLSYVPLAQTYLLDADATNDTRAEQLLTNVVDGTILDDPTAPMFRDGLVELGSYYYRTGQHARAIHHLNEVIERFPEDPRTSRVRYQLADANRLSAEQIERELTGAIPEARRRDLEALRLERLARALALFGGVIDDLGPKDARRMDHLEQEELRNASFYRGGAAFDLGDYVAAIAYYDAAYDRYQKDPASLVALVQIVNAYLEQGDTERARTSNERARRFFLSLPDDVWNDPYLPMGRREWERWLESTSRLYGMVPGG